MACYGYLYTYSLKKMLSEFYKNHNRARLKLKQKKKKKKIGKTKLLPSIIFAIAILKR